MVVVVGLWEGGGGVQGPLLIPMSLDLNMYNQTGRLFGANWRHIRFLRNTQVIGTTIDRASTWTSSVQAPQKYSDINEQPAKAEKQQ